MAIWDVIGPVMTGPSSSHTAGAVRLGAIVRACWGAPVVNADIYMRGSFASTGPGHGTDRAILAGLLGKKPDDPAVRDGVRLAEEEGLSFRFFEEESEGAHPNSARFVLRDGGERKMEAVGVSLGGGSIVLRELDGFRVELSCESDSVIIRNRDVQGVVGAVTSFLSERDINIATMRLFRDGRGGLATMVLELDSPVDEELYNSLCSVHEAIIRVISIPKESD